MSFDGDDVGLDRTTTVEINDVGTTKIELTEEAKRSSSEARLRPTSVHLIMTFRHPPSPFPPRLAHSRILEAAEGQGA